MIILIGLFTGCQRPEPEAYVAVPDPAFLERLLASGADKNGDGQISYAEAEAQTSLLLPPSGIADLTGLEAFIHLDSLTITLNPLRGIDLTAHRALRYLECSSCELFSLDISKNPKLEELNCGRNHLSELDISHNQSLTRLICNNNLLISLDLSEIAALRTLISCGNQLSYLDISKHSSLTKIGVDNMPMLTEVCVWALPFPPGGVVVLQGFSPNINFTTNCLAH